MLLTGAEGTIGRGFREEYLRRFRDAYPLRLGVLDPSFRDERFDDVVAFDITDLDAFERACGGAGTLVHLAANADWRAGFEELLAPNVVGAYHAFEAARRAGCRRVVFASSVHAVTASPPARQVRDDDALRPDSVYGAAKVFGEALASTYAHAHGLSCIAVRIGAYVPADRVSDLRTEDNPQRLDIVVTQRDLAQLIHRCVVASADVRFAIVAGVSGNRFGRMDLEHARRLLAYEPEDDAFTLSDRVRLGRDRLV